MIEKQNYKGIPIKKDIYPLIKYMDSVESYREDLSALSSSWDNLRVMGQLGNSNIDMESTKKNFSYLTEELLNHLATETLKKTVREMTAKAQIAVDIVIRNLFERTADIGFLATDDDIRQFLTNDKYMKERINQYKDDEDDTKYRIAKKEYKETILLMKQRFQEYVDKYSVYFDIVLMDTKGNILINLCDDTNVKESKDEIIDLVLNTNDDYIETYKYHDFLPQYENTLVYSYKVTKENDSNSKTIGILSLCFKFSDEMDGIFTDLIDQSTQECIMILNTNGKVIASSDKYHIPIGAVVETVIDRLYKVISFGGRYYLSKTCTTNGYQGFMGLGWYGHIMVPIEHAFIHSDGDSIDIKEEVLQAILQHGEGFSNDLKQIPIEASQIQNNLNRAVWNGNIAQTRNSSVDKNFTRLLLGEVSKTGDKTKNIFNSSIINLTKTMILNDTVSIASLMIDIMDRNLYERANDCRWWALTSEFRKILNNENLIIEDKEKLSNILSYINSLYTVYTNIFLYDTKGIIVAVSQKEQTSLIGKKLSNTWIEKTLNIKDSQKYCVSNFEETPLYNDKHTYIYNASLQSIKDSNKIVGGIGIVFDSQIEFKAMIQESLPKYVTGEVKNGVFGLFTTKDRMIISSSDDKYSVGSLLDLPNRFFDLKNGASHSEIITFDNKFYAVGVKCSHGYREFKSTKDEYINDVYSFFFSYISDANIPINQNMNDNEERYSSLVEECDDCTEIGTFYIGKKYLGVYAKDILEAINIKELESSIVLDDNSCFKGTVIYKKMAVSVLDISSFIKQKSENEYKEIIIVNYDGAGQNHYIGLLVDSLSDIVDVKTNKIKPIESHLIAGGSLIESIVATEDLATNSNLLTLLNITKLGQELTQ